MDSHTAAQYVYVSALLVISQSFFCFPCNIYSMAGRVSTPSHPQRNAKFLTLRPVTSIVAFKIPTPYPL